MQDWITSQHKFHTDSICTASVADIPLKSPQPKQAPRAARAAACKMPPNSKAAVKYDHNNVFQHALGSDKHADPIGAACAAACKMPQKAKAAVKHDHDHDVQHTLMGKRPVSQDADMRPDKRGIGTKIAEKDLTSMGSVASLEPDLFPDSDIHADRSSKTPQPKHAPRAACDAADKITPIAKAAVHTITYFCNMYMPSGNCPCSFNTKHDLVQHIVHTDDGYHSLDKMKAESKLMGTDKGPACAAPDDAEEYFIGTPHRFPPVSQERR
jgi:hypothetical protein